MTKQPHSTRIASTNRPRGALETPKGRDVWRIRWLYRDEKERQGAGALQARLRVSAKPT
jgi:hypothetical protein